jgi:hypothetical protein
MPDPCPLALPSQPAALSCHPPSKPSALTTMFAFKLSAKCNTIEELVAVLDRVSKMTGAGCKFSNRNDHGAAAFGFEITTTIRRNRGLLMTNLPKLLP